MASKRTEAKKKYEASHGIIAKSFKIRRDLAEQFADACQKTGVSQAGQIMKMMQEYIDSVKE